MTKFDRQPPKNRARRADVHAKGTALGKRAVHGTLTNLSSAGAFLRATRTLEVGDEVSLSFDLPTSRDGDATKIRIHVRAEVRHRGRGSQNGVGVQFVRMSREATEAIEAYLSLAPASSSEDEIADAEIEALEVLGRDGAG